KLLGGREFGVAEIVDPRRADRHPEADRLRAAERRDWPVAAIVERHCHAGGLMEHVLDHRPPAALDARAFWRRSRDPGERDPLDALEAMRISRSSPDCAYERGHTLKQKLLWDLRVIGDRQDPSEFECISMKPGAIASPVASISRAADALAASPGSISAAILRSLIATSAR